MKRSFVCSGCGHPLREEDESCPGCQNLVEFRTVCAHCGLTARLPHLLCPKCKSLALAGSPALLFGFFFLLSTVTAVLAYQAADRPHEKVGLGAIWTCANVYNFVVSHRLWRMTQDLRKDGVVRARRR